MATVLIIDDDEMICDLLCRHLRQKGYEAAHALTLTGGLKKARSENPDVVFLDVRYLFYDTVVTGGDTAS